MKFRLLDKAGKVAHEGVVARLEAPEVIVWGNRSFILSGKREAVPGGGTVQPYREAVTFKIGAF